MLLTLLTEPGHKKLHSGGYMGRKIAYWVSTVIVAVMLLFALMYLTGNPQVVEGFQKAGYPQHLRIVLGILKPLAAVILLLPGVVLMKEWAYLGVAFTWVMAAIAHYLAGDPMQTWGMPVALLALLLVSYFTRPPNRRLALSPAPAPSSGRSPI
jgi:hypothetical protein